MKTTITKRVIGMLLITVLCVPLFVGCVSGGPSITPDKSTEEAEVKYAPMLPDPELIFSKGSFYELDPDGGKAYIFEVKNYNDGEFESYVAKCKKMGFDDVVYDTDIDFGAYSTDGKYWVQVNLDSKKNVIYIVCQESKKEK